MKNNAMYVMYVNYVMYVSSEKNDNNFAMSDHLLYRRATVPSQFFVQAPELKQLDCLTLAVHYGQMHHYYPQKTRLLKIKTMLRAYFLFCS